jgi:hypothetical protein
LYKRIENLKAYHRRGYHRKVIKINFNDIALQIFDCDTTAKPKTVIWLAEIKAISVKTEHETADKQNALEFEKNKWRNHSQGSLGRLFNRRE